MSQPVPPPPPQQPPAWGPPQHPAWAPQPDAPPRRSTGRIVGITVAALAGLVGIGSCLASLAEDDGPGPLGDVRVISCSTNSLGWPHAELEITNHSNATSSYVVRVEFLDSAGVRYAEASAWTRGLAPGRAAAEKAQGYTKVPAGGQCRVVKVTRSSSR